MECEYWASSIPFCDAFKLIRTIYQRSTPSVSSLHKSRDLLIRLSISSSFYGKAPFDSWRLEHLLTHFINIPWWKLNCVSHLECTFDIRWQRLHSVIAHCNRTICVNNKLVSEAELVILMNMSKMQLFTCPKRMKHSVIHSALTRHIASMRLFRANRLARNPSRQINLHFDDSSFSWLISSFIYSFMLLGD